MDAGWWTTFEMSGWRAPYLRHAACRPPVDRLLVERRGWPLAGRTNCTLARSEAALVMLHLIPNLRRVALAYGLRVLGCPDYLLLGTFRRALSPWLDAWQCDRLLLTRQEWPSHRAFEADELATAAMATTGEQLDAICTARTSPGTSDTSGVPDDLVRRSRPAWKPFRGMPERPRFRVRVSPESPVPRSVAGGGRRRRADARGGREATRNAAATHGA